MSFLSISNLSKDYSHHCVVNDISFSIEQGEFISLLGPSGCGKSTTLNMIAGLETPTRGQIHLGNNDITHLPPGKRELSMVFQSYALFPHLSVKENILFGLKARRVDKQEQIKRLQHAIELVSLEEHINKKPSQLSGGQCQRVALARSIASQAPLCLMDEPLSNLDTKLRNEMRNELRQLQKSLGLTVVYVTHDQIEAMSMADKIILLNQGKVEQQGSPESFYQTPESTFVASFIGHPPMNLIPSHEYIIGVRPEHIEVQNVGHKTKINSCDYQGAATVINVDIIDGPFHGAKDIQLSLMGKHQLTEGSDLTINWSEQEQHLFSKSTGNRITNP
ncbi:ABC transporter ATP-binding protein [Marinomonas sp. BSi20584]|jgi:sn-glycerol 3-phosphate transport system ATP-binding protein|uniref:ABC transporter ATP-binding protein n=1 Tax=Marinomonas sp. BSi20584 TaxID=1594462 RepID=UPI000C1F1404|nr:ABC transporter ATP-binding protein [Marinomonas sp. BSi20584]PJE53845.1 ABC transporter ATP-binding protein [Marinomonas sp. BSi20584]